MNRFVYGALMPLALVVLAGCDDDPTDPSRSDVVGAYATTEFRAVDGDDERNIIHEGGYIHLDLEPDGTMTASMFVHEGGENGGDIDVDLVGTWELDGSIVRLDHDEDLFLRDIPLHFDEDDRTLTGNCCSTPEIYVTLEQVPELD